MASPQTRRIETGAPEQSVPPAILHEDDDLLVVNKPAGLNTHAPAPFAGDGLYDWLRDREPRWASLAIIHRLDKETSGVIVFAKSPRANRSLTEQFTQRSVEKTYLLLTDRPVNPPERSVSSTLVRAGERYVSRPAHPGGTAAITHFRLISSATGGSLVEARPLTGRTHQIRVHAAEADFPILGDTLYHGTPASRVCLHALKISFVHPATGHKTEFSAPIDFEADAAVARRHQLIAGSTAFRLVHGASDGWPGWYVDRLGDVLLAQSEAPLSPIQLEWLRRYQASHPFQSAHHKTLNRQVRQTQPQQHLATTLLGTEAPEILEVRENGVRFELRLREGYSVGLFLDQRDNRRRLLTGHVGRDFLLWTRPAPDCEVLNLFAYTCGFSACAALAGARATSIDLSAKYLTWGRQNFLRNQLDPANHSFLTGDVFDWSRRLARQKRSFDVVLLDPPTFSSSKASGVFKAEKDYGRLVKAVLPMVKPGGVLFCSCNASRLEPEAWLAGIGSAIDQGGRRLGQQHYVPQPFDFPISKAEPAYLKTVWMRLD